VGIIGLGYVGLPTAIGFHDAGFTVWGVDISRATVEKIHQGINPTGDPDVNDIIPQPGADRWNITTSAAEAVPHCDVVLVTVPTPITHDLKPDLSLFYCQFLVQLKKTYQNFHQQTCFCKTLLNRL